jgi:hypothetical protein
MSTTTTKALKKRTEKVKTVSDVAIVPDLSVIVKKTYRMAETLRNFPLPGE